VNDSPDGARQEFALHVVEGTGLFLRPSGEGVAIDRAGLAWRRDAAWMQRPWADLREIRLMRTLAGRSDTGATCLLRFVDGREVNVLSMNAGGFADAERETVYARFLRHLHEAVPEDQLAKVVFRTGKTRGPAWLAPALIIVMGAFFIALPLVLLVWTGEIKALLIAFAGFFFVRPTWVVFTANRERAYPPRRPPREMFP
jgi:hypothetical protein